MNFATVSLMETAKGFEFSCRQFEVWLFGVVLYYCANQIDTINDKMFGVYCEYIHTHHVACCYGLPACFSRGSNRYKTDRSLSIANIRGNQNYIPLTTNTARLHLSLPSLPSQLFDRIWPVLVQSFPVCVLKDQDLVKDQDCIYYQVIDLITIS